MRRAGLAAVLAIYQAGIEEGNATFETRAPGWEDCTAARAHRLLARNVFSAARSWAENGSDWLYAAGSLVMSSLRKWSTPLRCT